MTGHMKDSRSDFTATLLSDGRVLVAGGMNKLGASAEVLATAELYDPATGKFTPTGSMATARYEQAAVRLPDGRVLIFGGVGGPAGAERALSSAELFDPKTGTFSPTGSLPDGWWGVSNLGAVTILPDGRVFAFGYSCDAEETCLPSATLYDPTSRSFSAGGDLPGASALSVTWLASEGRATGGHSWLDYAATTLDDGQVLVTGGMVLPFKGDSTMADDAIMTAWLYDPATRSWSRTGSMLHARVGHAAVNLHDGRVLIVGGIVGEYCEFSIQEAAETYDPKTGKFSATGSLLQVPGESGQSSTVVVLADGKVLVAGGDTCEGVSTLSKTAEIYDPATGGFTYTKPMADEFVAADGVLLADGRVLIVGGVAAHSGASVSSFEAELYQP